VDKRTAKREACWRAAQVVRQAMGEGWPGDEYPEEDFPKVSDALHDVVAELERRGRA
jgi:hypothetical protein